VPLRETLVGDADRHLILFAGAVALVLLIAIANVATLTLVRTSAREQELFVRQALGAARWRVARLLVTESLVLTALAGLVGLGVTSVGLRIMPTLAPELARFRPLELDAAAVGFSLVTALVSGVLVSLSPVSLFLSGSRVTGARSDGRRVGTSRRTNALRAALVTVEFALALPLLLGAGLLLNSFHRLTQVSPGFDPAGVNSFSLSLPAARYGDPLALRRYRQRVVAAVEAVPGVMAAGFSTALPPNDPGDINNFDLLDRPVPAGTSQPVAPWSAVTPGFFEALGIPRLQGRGFAAGDTAGAPPVVIVSRAWAARFFPGEDVIGKRLVAGGCTQCPPTSVIGVVGDVKYLGLAGSDEAVYGALDQSGGPGMVSQRVNLVVRSRAPEAAVASSIAAALNTVDPELPLIQTTLTERINVSVAAPRRWASVLTAFAVTALALAALGILGLMSYVVRQRQREIGVRLALGAEPREVVWMIVKRGMRYAVLGTVLGGVIAALEARWLESLLFGVRPLDLATITAVAALLLSVALLACWLPGKRASRIRPLEAIAAE
jgi:predicted permease